MTVVRSNSATRSTNGNTEITVELMRRGGIEPPALLLEGNTSTNTLSLI